MVGQDNCDSAPGVDWYVVMKDVMHHMIRQRNNDLPSIGDVDCSAKWQADMCIADGWLWKGEEKYVRLNSFNEETGEFAATIVSSNKFLNGQVISGSVHEMKGFAK